MKNGILRKLLIFMIAFCLALPGGQFSRVVNATEAESQSDDGTKDEESTTKDDGAESDNSDASSEKTTETDSNTDTTSTGSASKKSTLQKTIDQAKKNAEDASKALDGVNKKIDTLSAEEEELTAEEEEAEDHLSEIIEELACLEMQLEEIEAEIEQTQQELLSAEEDERQQYAMMKLRIAYMYENNDSSALASILSKGSISEMLNALEYMQSVYDYDRNLLDEYEETVAEITSLKEELENERNEMQMIQAAYEDEEKELEKAIAVLQAKIGDVDAAIANATKKAKAYEATIAAENAKIKKAMEEQAKIEEEERKAAEAAKNKNSSSSKSSGESKDPGKVTDVSGSAVADYACQFVGNPYVFGGNSLTNGTDCSGFVNLVFSHFGISVPRSSYSLQHAGSEVSFDNARAGDIVCYSGHVAIYIGGGRIVHAKAARYGITTDNIIYSSKSVITIRRVL